MPNISPSKDLYVEKKEFTPTVLRPHFAQMWMLHAGPACIDHNPHKAIKTSHDMKHIVRLHMKTASLLSLTEGQNGKYK